MNVDVTAGEGWECWSPDVVERELTSFEAQARALTGLTEDELKQRLGSPNEEVGGTRWESASGTLILQADRDLRYFALLPHVVVCFAVAGSTVARISYMPKWRRCPAGVANRLGGAYAPE